MVLPLNIGDGALYIAGESAYLRVASVKMSTTELY